MQLLYKIHLVSAERMFERFVTLCSLTSQHQPLTFLERQKVIRLYTKKYNVTHFENKLVFKNVLRPHLKYHDYNDYTTLLFDLSPIDFDMVRF